MYTAFRAELCAMIGGSLGGRTGCCTAGRWNDMGRECVGARGGRECDRCADDCGARAGGGRDLERFDGAAVGRVLGGGKRV